MRQYLAITADEYEMPVASADTAAELGRMMGVAESTVLSAILRDNSGAYSGRRFICIDIDDN